jgi:hypothetical protein
MSSPVVRIMHQFSYIQLATKRKSQVVCPYYYWFCKILFFYRNELLISFLFCLSSYREQRFERVTKNLKVARVFTTLVEELKAMGMIMNDDSRCTEVMAPVAHSDRSPVLLLMGGGMGAGKSTVLQDILKEYEQYYYRPFYSPNH